MPKSRGFRTPELVTPSTHCTVIQKHPGLTLFPRTTDLQLRATGL